MVGWALKQAIVASILSGPLVVAGCTTVTPRVEPTPTTMHKTKVVRTTTAPNVFSRKGGGSGSGGTGGGSGGWG
ncbi:hypothetical protein FJV80_13660 [Mesorhizobium sp. WSM4310]|nr:hypothetical protein FJV80_13660 [Mesorhizobium sp. WSM4310]